MAQQITGKQMIEILAKEVGRLQKLCKDNGIDYTPPKPKGPGAALTLTPKVTVFESKEAADAALAESQKTN